MEIRPIHSELDYQEALAEIERLFDAGPGTPDGDRLELWITLVEDYEAEHDPIPLPDPIYALFYYLESRDLSPTDLEPYLGGHTRAILERRRALSIAMIRKLHAALGIPLEVLIQPYHLVKPAA
ncbi:MAG TPA: transcriptional regulator [Armatimonadota bacterium]|nr:transcriptional regulator [Armatimonadota bacterium]